MMLKRMPRMFSSQSRPSLVARWKALFTCSFISIELLAEQAGTLLGLSLGAGLAILDGLAQLVGHGLSRQVDTVVLVRRLGKASLAGGLVHGLTVRHNRVGDSELA